MKLKIKKNSLIKPFQIVSSIVSSRTTSEILSHILVTLKDKNIYLTSSDLEVEIFYTIENVLDGNFNNSFTIPSRKFLDIFKTFSDNSDIELVILENKLKIQSANSSFVLASLDSEQFPANENFNAETAIRGENLDKDKIEKAKKQAEHLMSNSNSEIDFARASLDLENAMAKLRVIEMTKHRK